MKPIEKLIRALRSGKYKKCSYFLKFNDSYCVLGLACKLYIEENRERGEICKNNFIINGKKCTCIVPDCIIDWLGISRRESTILSLINDSSKISFIKIADIIESSLLNRLQGNS